MKTGSETSAGFGRASSDGGLNETGSHQSTGASRGAATVADWLSQTKLEIDGRLERLFERKLAAEAGRDKATAAVLQALKDLSLRGGKRLRAWLVLVGERAAGGTEPAAALEAGVALELLQSYFLIHDDWMDQDSLRRGGPTVHVELGELFQSAHQGAIGAVLAGDYAVALATEVLSSLDIDRSRLPSVMACFASMQQDAVLGQELDLLARHPDPETVCRLKTASYTVRGPLVLGALVGGAGHAVIESLERFAEPAGVAFQWRDDLLSAFAYPEQTGKPRGNDIQAGKPTLLSELAFRLASPEDRRAFERIFGHAQANAQELEHALEIVERSGARAQVENRIRELTQNAREIVDSSSIDADAKQLLIESVGLLTGRVS